jgi:hypothetical protein
MPDAIKSAMPTASAITTIIITQVGIVFIQLYRGLGEGCLYRQTNEPISSRYSGIHVVLADIIHIKVSAQGECQALMASNKSVSICSNRSNIVWLNLR